MVLFLTCKFLIGKNTSSKRAFIKFIENTKDKNLYFQEFPSNDILPHLGWFFARSVENVLKQVRERYGSGREFVDAMRMVVEKEEDILSCYQKLIAMLRGFKGIDRKIANAVIAGIGYRVSELEEQQRKNLLNESWFTKLFLTSFFNVMIDTHVSRFFSEKLGIKHVKNSDILNIAKKTRKEVIQNLFEEWYGWLEEEYKKLLLEKYLEFIGANIIEKIIWMAYYVKGNLPKTENVKNLKLFKISGNLFL